MLEKWGTLQNFRESCSRVLVLPRATASHHEMPALALQHQTEEILTRSPIHSTSPDQVFMGSIA